MSIGGASWRGTELETRIRESLVEYRRLLHEMWERQLEHGIQIAFPYAMDLGIASKFLGDIGAKNPVTVAQWHRYLLQEYKLRKMWRICEPQRYVKDCKDGDGEHHAGDPMIHAKTQLPVPHPTHRFGWPMIQPQLEKVMVMATDLLFRSHRGDERVWLKTEQETFEDVGRAAGVGSDAAIGGDFTRGPSQGGES